MRASGYPVLSMIVSTVYAGEVALSIDGSSGWMGCIKIRKHRVKAKHVADERQNLARIECLRWQVRRKIWATPGHCK
jgi:hypothetical protein